MIQFQNYIFIFFLTICSIEGLSQNAISGTVIDKETGQPIAIVNIAIVRKGIGSNTNAEGKFHLIVATPELADTVQFSIIGYELQEFTVKQLLNRSTTVYLAPKVYALEEVTVKSKKLLPEDVMRDVVSRLEKNYNYEGFKLNGYYREVRNVNGKYDHLIEVALNTYGKKITSYFTTIEILNARKIDHARYEHGENLLTSTLRLDYIANTDGFIDLDNFKSNKYKFEDILLDGDKNIYVISAGVLPARKYTYYIREDDFAIVKIEMEDQYAERKSLYTSPIDRTHLFRLRKFKVVNIYKNYEGKYYPDLITVLWDYDKFNVTTRSVYENSSWLREFKVNRIYTKNYGSPDIAKVMKKYGVTIDDQMTSYNAAFWKDYNSTPLTSQTISDLESKGPLEDQFTRNGIQSAKKKKFNCYEKKNWNEKTKCTMEHYHDVYEIPGAQLVVSVNGKTVLSQSFGKADIEASIPVNAQTKFRIGGTSKVFTAISIMQLVQAGKIKLEVPVQTYNPGFPKKRWPVTIEELLDNVAGFGSLQGSLSSTFNSMTDAIQLFQNDSLIYQPNTDFRYSSDGYNLLGAVIESTSQTNFADYIDKNILQPAGMRSTIVKMGVTSKVPDETSYYSFQGGQNLKTPEENFSSQMASEGIISTAEDLNKLGMALLNNSLLSAETFRKFFRTPDDTSVKGRGFNLGWYFDTGRDGQFMIYHYGTNRSISSQLLVYPSKKIVVAYLSNTGADTFFDKDFADKLIEGVTKE
jgi:CubicO group peptidase (beta-lactamase class C family)